MKMGNKNSSPVLQSSGANKKSLAVDKSGKSISYSVDIPGISSVVNVKFGMISSFDGKSSARPSVSVKNYSGMKKIHSFDMGGSSGVPARVTVYSSGVSSGNSQKLQKKKESVCNSTKNDHPFNDKSPSASDRNEISASTLDRSLSCATVKENPEQKAVHSECVSVPPELENKHKKEEYNGKKLESTVDLIECIGKQSSHQFSEEVCTSRHDDKDEGNDLNGNQVSSCLSKDNEEIPELESRTKDVPEIGEHVTVDEKNSAEAADISEKVTSNQNRCTPVTLASDEMEIECNNGEISTVVTVIQGSKRGPSITIKGRGNQQSQLKIHNGDRSKNNTTENKTSYSKERDDTLEPRKISEIGSPVASQLSIRKKGTGKVIQEERKLEFWMSSETVITSTEYKSPQLYVNTKQSHSHSDYRIRAKNINAKNQLKLNSKSAPSIQIQQDPTQLQLERVRTVKDIKHLSWKCCERFCQEVGEPEEFTVPTRSEVSKVLSDWKEAACKISQHFDQRWFSSLDDKNKLFKSRLFHPPEKTMRKDGDCESTTDVVAAQCCPVEEEPEASTHPTPDESVDNECHA